MTPDGARGYTTIELLVAATIGLIVTGAALSLCRTGNRAVGRLLSAQLAWQETRAAAALWAGEWRGAGYDPTGTSAASVHRLTGDTLEFSADWNASGTLIPTSGNPNERIAWAAGSGLLKRGVNGGPRLPAAWPDSARFVYRDAAGSPLGPRPDPASVRTAELEIRLDTGGGALEVGWAVSRRNR